MCADDLEDTELWVPAAAVAGFDGGVDGGDGGTADPNAAGDVAGFFVTDVFAFGGAENDFDGRHGAALAFEGIVKPWGHEGDDTAELKLAKNMEEDEEAIRIQLHDCPSLDHDPTLAAEN